jgi:Domain of unknown function (DUF4124)
MLRPVVIPTLIVIGICSVAYADVYRWVDEHGEPHYSDRWVPGSELIKSDRPHPQTSDSSADHSSDQKKPAAGGSQISDKLAQQQNERAVKEDVAKTRDAQCEQAKDRYQKAIESRRLYKPSKAGDTDRVYMTDAEIDAYRAQARSDVAEVCGSPPPPMSPEQPAQPEKSEQ